MNKTREEFAVIFDMDGLMIESEHLQSQAMEAVLDDHGIAPEYTKAGLVQVVGISARDNWKRLRVKHSIPTSVDELTERKNKVYSKILVQGIEPMPGLHELINDLRKHNIKIAVASSSIPVDINEVLSQLGLSDGFDAIVSGTRVKRGKPEPDVFLETSKQMEVEPAKCVVLEDAESGIKAGKAAKMNVIAIPSQYTHDNDFSKADVIVKSLKELSYEKIKSLFFAV